MASADPVEGRLELDFELFIDLTDRFDNSDNFDRLFSDFSLLADELKL